MKITLSFDNGPHAEVTPRVLDVLARHGIKAWFFLLGALLQKPASRALVERELCEGHLVGNHSFSHQTPLGDDPRPDAPECEIGATQRLLEDLGVRSRMFRPFGAGGKIGPHLLSRAALDYLLTHRYSCVLWNCVPEDWIDHDGWPGRALEQCSATPWSLVVLHDYLAEPVRHLDWFIRSLKERGAVFTQELPPMCVPIVSGRRVGEVSAMVRELRP